MFLAGEPGSARVQLRVDDVAMVRLLGPEDRLLRTVEKQFPLVDVLVRGNEITLTGPQRAGRRPRTASCRSSRRW